MYKFLFFCLAGAGWEGSGREQFPLVAAPAGISFNILKAQYHSAEICKHMPDRWFSQPSVSLHSFFSVFIRDYRIQCAATVSVYGKQHGISFNANGLHLILFKES